MTTCIRREPQGLGQTLQYLFGRLHIASLLQRDIPGGADIGELGNLFAPQSWCTATETGWQSHIFWRETRSSGAQKVSQRLTAFCLIHVFASLILTFSIVR